MSKNGNLLFSDRTTGGSLEKERILWHLKAKGIIFTYKKLNYNAKEKMCLALYHPGTLNYHFGMPST